MGSIQSCGGKGRLVLEGRQQPGLGNRLDFEIAIRRPADARAGAGKLKLPRDAQRLIAAIPEQARCLAILRHPSAYAISICLGQGRINQSPLLCCLHAPSNESRMPPAASVPSTASRATSLAAVSEVYVEARRLLARSPVLKTAIYARYQRFGWIFPPVCP